MSTEQTIKDFLTNMSTQDNRSTAFPYFYVIRDRIFRPAPLHDCDEVKIFFEDRAYESKEELAELLRSDGYEELDVQEMLKRAQECGIKYDWKNYGLFLTETDAEGHLRQNNYHYSNEAHTYVDHAWRAPELEKFLLALFEHFGIKPQKR